MVKKAIGVLFIFFLVGAGYYIVYNQVATKETNAPNSDVEEIEKEIVKDKEEVNEDKEVVTPASKEETIDLLGNWTRNILNHTGHLTIIDATEEEFNFMLEVYAGGNVGSIEGKAAISNDHATFTHSESSCELTFLLTEDVITIVQTDECMYWGGAGTFFNGEYEKGEVNIDTNLVKQGILTEKEDELFRSVVGDDYDLYLYNISTYMDGEDADGLGTRVVKGFVRGIAPFNGGIIMINDKYVYAAVTDSESSAIKYHTNDPNYKKKLPVTVEEWAEEMSYTDIKFQ